MEFVGIGTVYVPDNGLTIKLPPASTKKFHKFAGWYTNKSLTKAFTEKTKNSKDLVIYPKYTPKSYTVTFKANGGKVAEKGKTLKKYAKTVTYGTKIGKILTPTRDGYDFKGWTSKKSGGVKVNDKTVLRTGNVTYYARWKKK